MVCLRDCASAHHPESGGGGRRRNEKRRLGHLPLAMMPVWPGLALGFGGDG